MKKLVVLMLLIVGGTTVYAQQNAVKLNLVGLALGRASIGYERAFAAKHSGVIWLDYGKLSSNGTGEKFSYKQAGVNLEYRFYPGGEAPRRFFVGPYAVVRSIAFESRIEGTATSPNDNVATYVGSGKVSTMNVGGGVQLGYQFIIGNVFTIDLFGGLGIYSFNLGDYDVDYKYSDGTSERKTSDNTGSISLSGLMPRLGIALGAAF